MKEFYFSYWEMLSLVVWKKDISRSGLMQTETLEIYDITLTSGDNNITLSCVCCTFVSFTHTDKVISK